MKPKKSKRPLIIVLIVAVVAIALAAGFFFMRRNKSDASGEAVYVIRVGDQMSQSVSSADRFKGIVENQKTVNVAFDTSRALKECYVAVGDHVKKGDKLFSYSDEKLKLELEQLELEIERNKSTIENNKEQIEQLTKEREKAASADKPGYSAQILQAEADISQAEYDIKTKENEIESKKIALNNSVVYADLDAMVKKMAELEDNESGGSTVTMESTGDGSANMENVYLVLQADGDFRIKGTISENAIGSIYEGMAVTVRSRTDSEKTWAGTISTINTQNTAEDQNMYGNSSENTASKYNFYVELENSDGMIVGQHVTIETSSGEIETKEGIWINAGYVVYDEEGSYIWTAKGPDSKLEKTFVETGDYDENNDDIQIISGITEDTYIAWPDEMCTEGAKVIDMGM